jgi:hypothetical protein
MAYVPKSLRGVNETRENIFERFLLAHPLQRHRIKLQFRTWDLNFTGSCRSLCDGFICISEIGRYVSSGERGNNRYCVYRAVVRFTALHAQNPRRGHSPYALTGRGNVHVGSALSARGDHGDLYAFELILLSYFLHNFQS